jgi:hypothetical protein
MRVFAAAALMLASLSACVWATDLAITSYYLHDNLGFSVIENRIGVQNAPFLGGECNVAGKMRIDQHAPASYGFAVFRNDLLGVEFDYSRSVGPVTAGVHAGIDDSVAFSRVQLGARCGADIRFRNGLRLAPQASWSYGPSSENAVANAVTHAHAWNAQIAARFRYWEWAASYGENYFDAIDAEAYAPYVQDSVKYVTLQRFTRGDTSLHYGANNLRSAALYAYGPPIPRAPFFYSGVSATYRHARTNFYTPVLIDKEAGAGPTAVYTSDIVSAYFPYRTPRHEVAASVSLALTGELTVNQKPVAKGQADIAAPIYSYGVYRSYYMNTSGYLVGGISYSDDPMTGLAPMRARGGWTVYFPMAYRMDFSASLFSLPYVPYGWFGPDSYRYVDVSATLRKTF